MKTKIVGLTVFATALAAAWWLGQAETVEVITTVEPTVIENKNVPVDYTKHNDAVFKKPVKITINSEAPVEEVLDWKRIPDQKRIDELTEKLDHPQRRGPFDRTEVDFMKTVPKASKEDFLMYFDAYKAFGEKCAPKDRSSRMWFFLFLGIQKKLSKGDPEMRRKLLSESPDLFPKLAYYYLGIAPTDPVWQARYAKYIARDLKAGRLDPSENWPPNK